MINLILSKETKQFSNNILCQITWVSLLFFPTFLFAQNLYPIKIQQQWGLIDAQGNIQVEAEYEAIGPILESGYRRMQQNGKLGLLDQSGQILLPARYEEITVCDTNFIAVTKAKKKFILNTTGKTIFTGQYEQLKALNLEFIAFKQRGFWGCMNAKGQVICKPEYTSIELLNNSYFKVEHDDKFGLCNKKGTLILPVSATDIHIRKDLIFYQADLNWGAVNEKGQKVIQTIYENFEYLKNNDFIKLKREHQYDVFYLKSQTILNKKPKQDFRILSDQYLVTQSEEGLGIINTNGKEVLENKYLQIRAFSESAFRIFDGQKWGLVDTLQKELLAYKYDFIAPIRNGMALLKKKDLYGLINAAGKILLPTKYSKINIKGENIKAFKGARWTLYYLNENGTLQRSGNFKKHYKIQIAANNTTIPQRDYFGNDEFENDYEVEDFIWFKNPKNQKWGLKRISNDSIEIKAIFDVISIEKDLGYTIVGIKKKGQYRFDRSTYRFSHLYGIVNNKIGKLVSPLNLWDIRSDDFRQGSKVARCIFSNGRHGLILQNGKIIKKDLGYVGAFKNGYAKISVSGKIAAHFNPTDKSLGKLSNYLNNIRSGNDRIDFTIHDRDLEAKAYLTCQDCTWGFVDTTGQIVIKPQYEIAKDFINEKSIVKHKGKWGLIDQKGNTVLDFKYDALNFLVNTDNQILQLGIYTPKFGLLDTLGQLLVQLSYDDIGSFKEGRLAVRKGNLWGYLSDKGANIISPKYQKVKTFSEGLAAVKWRRKWVFIDKFGSVKLDDQYRALGNFKQGLAWAKKDKGVGFINKEGQSIIPFQYSKASDFSDGIAIVAKGGKYGLIDQQGNYILKPRYSKIEAFNELGLAIVRFGNKRTHYGLIDRSGKLITDRNYQKIFPFKEGRALVRHRNGYGYIDKNGNLVIEGNFSDARSFSEGRAMIQRNGRCGFIDLAGNEIVQPIYSKCLDFSGGKAVVYQGIRKGGIIDKNGKEIIEPGINQLLNFKEGRGLVRKSNYQFYYITEEAKLQEGTFEAANKYKNGIAIVRKNGKWGVINQFGLTLIAHKYDQITSLDSGFTKVKLNQFSGLANLEGHLIIPPQYEYIQYINDNLFKIENQGKIGYIDNEGEWVWSLRE